jgi:methylase of polypeptide subunit release factors
MPSADPYLPWTHPDGHTVQARWRSESGAKAPQRVRVIDDTTPADVAYKLACEGTGLLWQGDFQNARHLLQALTRRLDKQAERASKGGRLPAPEAAAEAFHKHRQNLGHRARILGMLLIPVEAGHVIALRRAADLRQACEEAYGPADESYVLSLRELLGLNGAHEWRKKGVEVPALKGRVHAHYGVFSPLRGEYVDLVAQVPLPKGATSAFDIGTGTGVLAAVLARRGLKQVIGTDQDPRALACAHANVTLLKLQDRIELVEADLFPEGRADVVACNPPWVPARPSSPIEYAVYDPDSRMLRGFLAGLRAHVSPQGEGWLILSDLAEHLGLRSRDELLQWIAEAGLTVAGRLDVRPRHPKTQDKEDPLHRARAAEVTSLWRLKPS